MNMTPTMDIDNNETQSVAWYGGKVLQLSENHDLDTKLRVLEELTLALSTLNKSQVLEVTKSVALGCIYECLYMTQLEQIKLALSVLETLLKAVPPHELAEQFSSFVERAFRHSSDDVKKFGADIFRIIVHDESSFYEVQSFLLEPFVGMLGCDNVDVFVRASEVAKYIGDHYHHHENLMTENVKLVFGKFVDSSSSIARCRAYEMLVNMVRHSEENISQADPFLLKLVTEVYSADILLGLNAFEILTSLASTMPGLQFLESKNFFQDIENRWNGPYSLNVIEFVGITTGRHPAYMFKKHRDVLLHIFNMCQSGDISLRMCAMCSVGEMASGFAGKFALTNLGDRTLELFSSLQSHLENKDGQVKAEILLIISKFLSVQEEEAKEDRMKEECLTQEWFHLIFGEDGMRKLLSLNEDYSEETKFSALRVVHALMTQKWAQKLMTRTPGFVGWLSSPCTSPSSKLKELKLDIQQMIIDPESHDTDLAREMRRLQFQQEILTL